MSTTLDQMKIMRLDLALSVIADDLHDAAHERWVFEESYARRMGVAWSIDGARLYRAMSAAEALIRTFIAEAKGATKATNGTPPWAIAAGEAARREWLVSHIEGERHVAAIAK